MDDHVNCLGWLAVYNCKLGCFIDHSGILMSKRRATECSVLRSNKNLRICHLEAEVWMTKSEVEEFLLNFHSVNPNSVWIYGLCIFDSTNSFINFFFLICSFAKIQSPVSFYLMQISDFAVSEILCVLFSMILTILKNCSCKVNGFLALQRRMRNYHQHRCDLAFLCWCSLNQLPINQSIKVQHFLQCF